MLLKDEIGYVCNFKLFSYNDQTGFFAFYDCAKKWLHSKFQDEQAYNDKLKELKLDEPYKLAIELFKAYVDFRKNATQGAQYQNGYNDSKDLYKPNIYDLFTKDDLINLGGNEFIKDCLKAVDVPSKDIEPQYIGNLKDIFNINTSWSHNGNGINKLLVVTNTDLISAVDNHMSWPIFKSKSKNLKLTNDEKVLFSAAVGLESFWKKHLWMGELKTLPFTGSAASLLGLVGGLVFGITGGPLALLILTPIGAGAVFVAPSVGRTSRIAALTNFMEQESARNTKYNNYQQYKESNSDFRDLLQQKRNEIKEGIKTDIKESKDIISTDQREENQIIPRTGSENTVSPLSIVKSENVNDQNDQNDQKRNIKGEQPKN